jgi:hypothetical protein
MSRGRLGTGEPAGYSGAEGSCLPRYAFGFAWRSGAKPKA